MRLCLRRSVGTFARALDCTSTVRQPSLHMSAAAASRDITLVSLHFFPQSILSPVFLSLYLKTSLASSTECDLVRGSSRIFKFNFF